MTEVTEVISSSWAHSRCIGKHWGGTVDLAHVGSKETGWDQVSLTISTSIWLLILESTWLNQYPNIPAILLLLILSQRYVLGWAAPLVTVTTKNHHIVQFLVGLCMSLLVTVVGRWQRYAFTWFLQLNPYFCGVPWSFGMRIWLGPPMDQRGSRRVCGRIWLRSTGLQWEWSRYIELAIWPWSDQISLLYCLQDTHWSILKSGAISRGLKISLDLTTGEGLTFVPENVSVGRTNWTNPGCRSKCWPMLMAVFASWKLAFCLWRVSSFGGEAWVVLIFFAVCEKGLLPVLPSFEDAFVL